MNTYMQDQIEKRIEICNNLDVKHTEQLLLNSKFNKIHQDLQQLLEQKRGSFSIISRIKPAEGICDSDILN